MNVQAVLLIDNATFIPFGYAACSQKHGGPRSFGTRYRGCLTTERATRGLYTLESSVAAKPRSKLLASSAAPHCESSM